ncbi:16326_t:CDS:2 [Funneliformis caledonium]|uniref:16326_t:CDS:1 n=1 Tax=Funneliformis caledonium TaxID=1117310 RepID=A0A9N9HUT5_9GLOM|nr:16326_t:CDS:2 [Funneliformis caledonium]
MSSFTYCLEKSNHLYLDISKDPYAKTEWLLHHFGKTHELFHGIRLGPTFINENIFGSKSINVLWKTNPALTEQKITFNAIQSGSNKLKIHILQEGAAIFSELLLISVKGNDTLESKSEIIKQLHRPKENLELFFRYIIVVIGHSFKLFTIEELGC